jgi:hypothetical protein
MRYRARGKSKVTLVSGLPRSGTSLMMQMLAAGGMPILADDERKPDVDNPRGYYEWSKITQIVQQPELLAQAEGKAVKCVFPITFSLPPNYEYKIIFMERDVEEMVRSQRKMIERLQGQPIGISDEVIIVNTKVQLAQIKGFLKAMKIETFFVRYHSIVQGAQHDPTFHPHWIADFLKIKLDCEAMARQVDEKLYRNRANKVLV